MPHTDADLKNWHDWTNPDFFATARQGESRVIPLFLRQILPTRVLRTRITLTGWFLIIVSLGLGLAAYNNGSNILFLALSLLLSSLILSGFLSLINFRKLDWHLKVSTNLRAGEISSAGIDLSNQKTLFPSMNLCFLFQSDLAAQESEIYTRNALNPNESCTLKWSFKPEKRGQYELRVTGVRSKFPFGFLQRTVPSDLQANVKVWPARTNYTFSVFGSGHHKTTGSVRNKLGQGSDLLNIRSYEYGDTPRLIHWKATARTGRLMVRQLADEGESGYHLYVNSAQDLWDEVQFELLCSLVASLAEDLFHQGRLETVKLDASAPLKMRAKADLHGLFDQLAVLERYDRSADILTSQKPNQLTFGPSGEEGVIVYLGGDYAGQADVK